MIVPNECFVELAFFCFQRDVLEEVSFEKKFKGKKLPGESLDYLLIQVGQHWPGNWIASSQFCGKHLRGEQEILPDWQLQVSHFCCQVCLS